VVCVFPVAAVRRSSELGVVNAALIFAASVSPLTLMMLSLPRLVHVVGEVIHCAYHSNWPTSPVGEFLSAAATWLLTLLFTPSMLATPLPMLMVSSSFLISGSSANSRRWPP